MTSTIVAQAVGLWPGKGAIAEAADAGLTLVDVEKHRVVRAADLVTSADFTPYEGMQIAGWPVPALLRGRVIMRDGRPEEPATGRYLWRERPCTT